MKTRSKSRGGGKDRNSLTRGKRRPAKVSSTSESESSEESTFTTLQKKKNCPRQRGKGRVSGRGRKPPPKRTRASLQVDTSTSESDSSETTEPRASTRGKKPPPKRNRTSLKKVTSTSESDSAESTQPSASTRGKKAPPKRTRASLQEDTSISESDSAECTEPRASTRGKKPPPKRNRASLREDTSTSVPRASTSRIESSSGSDQEHEVTPNNHGNRKEPRSRTSERIRKRKNKEFHMPTRREVFEAIGEDSPPERQVRRVLASSFTRETHSYNQDRLSNSEVSSVDDFIVHSDHVDTSSSEDVNEEESQTDRYRRLANEQRRRLRPLEDKFDAVQRDKWKRLAPRDPSSSEEENRTTIDVVNVNPHQGAASDTSCSEESEPADIPPQPPDTLTQTQALVPVTEACPQGPPQVVPYCDEDDSIYGEGGDPVGVSRRGNIPETNEPHQTENSDQRTLQGDSTTGGPSSGTSRGTGEAQVVALQPDDDLENLMLNLEEAVQSENKEQLEVHSPSDDAVSLLVVSSSEEEEVTSSSRVDETVQSNQVLSRPDIEVVEVVAKPSCSKPNACMTDDRQKLGNVDNPMVCNSDDDEDLANISLQPDEETTQTSKVGSQGTQAAGVGGDALADLSEQVIPAQRKANRSMVIESDNDSDEAQGSETKPTKSEHSEEAGASNCTIDNKKNSKSTNENNEDTSDEEIKHIRPNRSFVIESDESGVEQLNSSTTDSESGSDLDSESEDERGRSKRARLMKSKKDAWREKFEQYKKARKKSNT